MGNLKPTVTLKRFEASRLDHNLDRAGKHGKENSAEDRRKDAKMVKDMNTKYKKPPEKDIKGAKGTLPKVTHKGRHQATPPLARGAAEKMAKGGKLPGKMPGKKMGTVAKVAKRGTR